MKPNRIVALLVLALVVSSAGAIPPPGNEISAADRAELTSGADTLGKEIEKLKAELAGKPKLLALLPDVLIYYKAVDWPLRYKELIDVKKARAALAKGMERVAALREGKAPWVTAGGVRAYVSKVDGSVQPYLLNVPKDYAETKKTPAYRLDFFYHGRGENLTELNFISGKVGEAGAAGASHFTVYPYGRYCCANKFAGEIDTFEILESMKLQYPIDSDRVIEMGFSMGGAASWHMAVHYPDQWVAASPGAGFAETRQYQKMDASGEWDKLPWYRVKLFHLYDCPDYATNLSMLPLISYAGDQDPQKQSGDVMEKAMAERGLKLERIWGPKVGHKYEPEAKKELDARLAAYAEKGRNRTPKELHFETWTTRYNSMHWLTVDALERHWERAKVDGKFEEGALSLTTSNVSAMTIRLDGVQKLTIDGKPLPVTGGALEKRDGTWSIAGPITGLAKRHGIQGPIDDAFMDSFLIIKPTGPALNEKVGQWCNAEAEHAAVEWRKIFRGEAPVKLDKDVTEADIAANNLVLFGDSSSNAVLKKIADKLPIAWDAKSIKLGERTFDGAGHALVMIYPNPLNPKKYVLLNSGHTFREADHKTNSRQVAKLPDYAVIDLSAPADDKWPGGITAAGFFDEQWRLQKDDGQGK